jgi:tetratricopeptide (TPR) repeat protein
MSGRRVILIAAVASLMRAPTLHAANADIAAGDALFAARTVSTGAAEAVAGYEKAFVGADAAEAEWKAARAYYWLGDQSAVKKDKLACFEKGIADAKTALAAAPKRPEPHFWLAALYGGYGETRGVLKSLMLVSPMREQLKAINRIDERYQGGAGDRILGIVDYKVPGFAGGSRKEAIIYLEKSLAIDPTNAYNQYYMAECLFELGRKKEARAFLYTLAALGTNADVDAQDLASMKRKGEALAQRIK